MITGLGIVSPIGIGRERFSESLRERTSGVRPIQQYDTSQMEVRFGGELDDFQPKLYVKPRKSLKVMSREIQMGVAASTLAFEDAQLAADEIDVERLGVVYGSPMLYADLAGLRDVYQGCMQDGKFDFSQFGEQFPKQMLPLWMLKFLPNMTASHIGIAHGARGPNNSIVQGDVSSLLAMIEATTVIQRGIADTMLTGGAGSRLAITPVTYRTTSNLSHRNENPQDACRPFDANRDGMVLGEGAATMVLEERTAAQNRGANILASILSYAVVHTGSDITGGMQSAIERSITQCLKKANVAPGDIGHVNAHGVSEVDHDVRESAAIRNTLGDVKVTATKSFFGNIGAGASALELSASLVEGSIPPTLNFETPDPECDINVVTAPQTTAPLVLKLSQNSTGQATAILVRKH